MVNINIFEEFRDLVVVCKFNSRTIVINIGLLVFLEIEGLLEQSSTKGSVLQLLNGLHIWRPYSMWTENLVFAAAKKFSNFRV
jgi:hypothetical protein